MFHWLTRLFASDAGPQQPSYSGTPDTSPGAFFIGRTKDLVKVKHLIAPADPRRSLFTYHELREEEEKQWSRQEARRCLESEDPEELTQLTIHIQGLKQAYSSQEMQDLVDVQPNAADSSISDLCRRYCAGTDVTRTFLRSEIDFERAWTLLTYSKRAAVLSVRASEPALIQNSLIAHAIENLAAEDVRDNLMALGLIFHCARAVCHDPVAVFREVAEMAAPATSLLLRDFVERPDLDHILSAMGWQEVCGPQGVGFRWET